MNEVALEMGVFFIFVTICGMLLLHEVRGDMAHLNRWLLTRKLYTLRNRDRNPARIQGFLTTTTYFYLALPIISLVGWNGLLYWDYIFENRELKTKNKTIADKDLLSIYPIISTSLVTVAFFSYVWAVMIQVWNQYMITMKSAILQLITLVLFGCYLGI
jgi:hypothetical protein